MIKGNPAVYKVQQRLSEWGYSLIPNGVMDDETKKTIQKWKTSQGLTPDALVDAKTSAILFGRIPKTKKDDKEQRYGKANIKT